MLGQTYRRRQQVCTTAYVGHSVMFGPAQTGKAVQRHPSQALTERSVEKWVTSA